MSPGGREEKSQQCDGELMGNGRGFPSRVGWWQLLLLLGKDLPTVVPEASTLGGDFTRRGYYGLNQNTTFSIRG